MDCKKKKKDTESSIRKSELTKELNTGELYCFLGMFSLI